MTVEGDARVPLQDVCSKIRTRAGAPLDAAQVAADIRALWATGDFDDVSVSRGAGGGAVFTVRERPILDDLVIEDTNHLRLELAQQPIPRLILKADGKTITEPITVTAPAAGDSWDMGKPIWEGALHVYEQEATAGLVDEGYRSATVEAQVKPTSPGHAAVRIIIAPGPRAIIKTFTFSGLSKVTSAALLARVDHEGNGVNGVGKPYSDGRAARDAYLFYDLLMSKGLLMAKVGEVTPTFSSDGTSADLHVDVVEGPVYRMGSLKFTDRLAKDGAAFAKLVPVHRGDVFDRSALLAGLARINDALRKRGDTIEAVPETALDEKTQTVALTIR